MSESDLDLVNDLVSSNNKSCIVKKYQRKFKSLDQSKILN